MHTRDKYYKQESQNLSTCKQALFQFVLLGTLICAILINIIQFYPIDYQISGRNYSVLNSYGTGDLLAISYKYSGPNIRARFSPYLGLSQIAPGAIVTMPLECPLITYYLYGLGRVAHVERLNYDAETRFADFDTAYYEVEMFGRVDDRGPGEVAIVTGKDKPLHFIALLQDEIWHLVDVELLDDNIIEELLK